MWKIKLLIAQKMLISNKNVMNEKRFRIVVHTKIRIKKYQNLILRCTETLTKYVLHSDIIPIWYVFFLNRNIYGKTTVSILFVYNICTNYSERAELTYLYPYTKCYKKNKKIKSLYIVNQTFCSLYIHT